MLTAAELTAQMRNGNKDALFAVMAFYYNDLFRYGIRFTADRDLTKDVIGQFFLHIWDHRERFCAAGNTKSYLIVAFKRFMIHYLQRISRELNLQQDQDYLYEYSYEEYLIACQDNENMRSALATIIQTLPARQKELVQLRFYEQLSFEEIAVRTSLSIRTIYNKLHEALKKMRAHALAEDIRREIR